MGSIYRILSMGLLATGFLFSSHSIQAAEPLPSTLLVDISAPHWCFDCVSRVVDQYRLMDGYADHTFRGDWKASRFALAVIQSKLLNRIRLTYKITIPPNVQADRAIPVLPEHWAYPYVRTLRQDYNLAGLLFKLDFPSGDLPASRKHMAYILSELLMKAESASGRSLGEGIRLAEKAQDIDLRSPYTPYITAALNRYQFIHLYHDHTFRPENPVSRYELAAALCRVVELIENHLAVQPTSGTP